MLLMFALFYSIIIQLYISVPPNYLRIIRDFPKCWDFLTYDGFKSHVNVTEGLNCFSDERIRIGKEESGTRTFNQAYDKFQANQDKAQTSQILELALWKVHGQINQWHIIMIISKFIKKFLLNTGQITLLLINFILITS